MVATTIRSGNSGNCVLGTPILFKTVQRTSTDDATFRDVPVSHQPAHIKYVPFTRDQMREQTRQLAETIRAVTLMRCADTGPFKVHIECPACHLFEAIELETRFGRISYFCPACENYWDVGAREPLPTKHI